MLSNNTEYIVGLKNVYHAYDMGEISVKALKNIELEIIQGDYVAVVGHSGSGKSTLLRIIGALEIPTKGEVHMCGKAINKMNTKELINLRSNVVGFVYQDFQLLPQLSALENVMIPLMPMMKYDLAKKSAEKSLETVGLKLRMNHKPSELSGGEQQRVSIARALTREPKILLADEPTGNLDTSTRDQLMEILDDLNKKGLSIIIATHDMEIVTHCNKYIKLKDGEIVKEIQ
ncbi:ABC transporter ATP-binding protein [Brassicibacter mesophilus]|uniref:ABC transporter ATP-binding protein n=1 Tax=Brassicibacter mesophilus TaxID=745119 RepID=UPI003D258EF2